MSEIVRNIQENVRNDFDTFPCLYKFDWIGKEVACIHLNSTQSHITSASIHSHVAYITLHESSVENSHKNASHFKNSLSVMSC